MVTISQAVLTRQILSASATLCCRIGVIFCVFQGGKDKSEAKARKTRGKREVSAKRELLARRASLKIPLVRIALLKLFCICTQLGLRARVVLDPVRQNIREKLVEFVKLVISTATAHVETAIKFDTVVKFKLAGFQW